MRSSNEIILLKLGGSLLTDKNKYFSIRENVIKSAVQQIIDANEKLIIIHGGGSFGHPLAKKYSISKGLDKSIPNQILGLAETHEAMNKLNTYIINRFLEKNNPAISIQASSIFIKDSKKISTQSIDVIEAALNLGVIPVLYGDIILDKKDSFSIISGDRIILELCKNLKKFTVLKVIFTIEKDGIYIKDRKENIKLALEFNHKELDNIRLAELDQKIDVTGGIEGKINSIKEISKLNIPVQIINGLKEKSIFKALKGLDLKCTNIKISTVKAEIEEIRDRKLDHLKIPIEYDVQHSENYLKYIKLIHHPLPEINFNEIDLSVKFFNKKVSAPICIAAITGGHPISKKINRILAEAAEKEKIIMSVGSQRAGLVDPTLIDSFSIVRDVAPSIPIMGNIGIGQLSDPNFNIEDFNKCVKMINADAMAIHFNALHELIQDKGDRSYKYFGDNFQKIRASTNTPIIAKEVGAGFNQEIALKLNNLGFDGFDVGGAGGTSFAAVESHRNFNFSENFTRNPAEIFREWGIPTPVSIHYVRKVTKKLIIATGGLRTGIDIAKCISLGADIGGFAYKFLLSSWKDYKNNSISHTIKEIRTLKNELRSCLWLMNLKNIIDLKGNINKRVIFGKLNQWLG
ncbi:MAG: type 2 isopentenyl-diphosphate Delta-isomerase [Candidatus Thorarchaeota archaeon]